jgi:hypothetical protein
MSHIDEGELARVMEVLPAVLAREEMVVQRCLPRLSPADMLDAALKRSLARLRFDLSQDSFEHLRWKVAMARAEHQRLSARARLAQEGAMASATQSRAAREELGSTPRRFQSRTFMSEHGITWTVSELTTLTPTDPHHATCLVFTSEEAVLCVWEYPANWRELPDAELDALRKRR